MKPRALFIGSGAALGLLAFYLGIMSLDGGLGAALRELSRERWLIGGIVVAFGVQVALFSTVRARSHALANVSAAPGAVTTGTTAGSMLACCLHHAADVLPLVGLTALGTFFGQYRSWLFGIAYLSSAVGIMIMVRALRRMPVPSQGSAVAAACH